MSLMSESNNQDNDRSARLRARNEAAERDEAAAAAAVQQVQELEIEEKGHEEKVQIENQPALPQQQVPLQQPAIQQQQVPLQQHQVPLQQVPQQQQPLPAGLPRLIPEKKIETLIKQIVVLTHNNYSAWDKCIEDIAYYRCWNRNRLLNKEFTWDKKEEADAYDNLQRRDAYWVLKTSIPPGSDYYHLITGVTRGDANALYKKIKEIFQANTASDKEVLKQKFYQLSMASTKLDVARFASKVVEVATELEEVNSQLDENEITTRFLNGLSRKFEQIVTVETVAENNFETTLKNVINHAKKNKLLFYRETSTHAHHYMAQAIEHCKPYKKPYKHEKTHRQGNNKKPNSKKWYKKKQRPSKQFKQWSAKQDVDHKNYQPAAARPNQQNRSVRFQGEEHKHDYKQPFLCMNQEINESTENKPVARRTLFPREKLDDGHDSFPVLQVTRLAQECKTTRVATNKLIYYFEKERVKNRILEKQVQKLKGRLKLVTHRQHEFLWKHHYEWNSIPKQFDDEFLALDALGSYMTDYDSTDEERAENDPEYGKYRYEDEIDEDKDSQGSSSSSSSTTTSSSSDRTQGNSSSNTNTGSNSDRENRAKKSPKSKKEDQEMLMTYSNTTPEPLQHHHEEAIHEIWLCDSGSSYHIVPSEEDFDPGTMVPCSVSLRIGDSSQVQADTMGQCTRMSEEGQMIIMKDVLLAPNCPTRILAVGKLTKGGEAIFLQDKTEAKLITNDDKGKLIMKGKVSIHDTATVVLAKLRVQIKTLLPMSEEPDSHHREQILSDHRKWGHISFDKVRAIRGLPKVKDALEDLCNDCWKAEMKEPTRKKETVNRADRILYRIHMDLTGKKAKNIKGYRIALVIVDDKSRYTWTYMMKSRDEWVDKVIWWVRMIQKANPPYEVSIIRTDSEPTISTNTRWIEWLEQQGIQHEVAAPYSQHQNGVAERRIGMLNKMTKAMLFTSGLPPGDWHYALEHATFLLNRIFSTNFPSPDGYLSPQQVFYQGAPEYVPEGVFGCHTMAKIYVKGKMAPQAQECIWLGKREHVKADLVRKLSNNRECYSRVNKKSPTVFPYLNTNVNKPLAYEHKNFGSFSEDPDWTQNFYEPIESLESGSDFYSDLTGPEGGLDLGLEPTTNQNEAQSIRVGTRNRVPSLRSVEALSNTLQVSLPSHSLSSSISKNNHHEDRKNNDMDLQDPPSRTKMLSYPDRDDWIVSEEKELHSIIVKHKGFTYKLREDWMNVLPSHFIYKYKLDPYGRLITRKTRFVAGGHKQEYAVDFFDTYAATTQLESVRFMLAVAASFNACITKFDIETFFLYGKPDTDIYIEQPPGHEIVPAGAPSTHKHKDYVVRLNVALYGCKQSPRLANLDVTK